jgi:putative endonuclease
MMTKIEIGQKGEDIANAFLQEIGCQVLHRNFRFKRSEIDIIFIEGNFLVFGEVKYRFDSGFGYSETFVSEGQEEKIRQAAEEFLNLQAWEGPIRFDIISITGPMNNPDIEHFKDAF